MSNTEAKDPTPSVGLQPRVMPPGVGALHIHEALDRSAAVETMLHELLSEHPALACGDLRERFEVAARAVADLYQEAGRVSLEYTEAA